MSVNSSTCFGLYLHPSSGAHVTVSAASGICETVTATCSELQSRSRQAAVTVLQMPDAVDTVTWAPDDGWRYHPKHVELFTDINKLYIVASRWIIIDIYSRCTEPWTWNAKHNYYNNKNAYASFVLPSSEAHLSPHAVVTIRVTLLWKSFIILGISKEVFHVLHFKWGFVVKSQ
jgi:hypothetical protein